MGHCPCTSYLWLCDYVCSKNVATLKLVFVLTILFIKCMMRLVVECRVMYAAK